MKELKNDDKVIINGRKGIVGTVRGMATSFKGVSAKYNTDPEEDFKKAKENGHETYWINQEPGMLCGDPGYAEERRKRWENAILLEDGEKVIIEGEVLTVKYKGNFFDMVSFV